MAVITQDHDTDRPDDGQGANLTILEHLQELRKRLMICAAGVVLGLVAGAE